MQIFRRLHSTIGKGEWSDQSYESIDPNNQGIDFQIPVNIAVTVIQFFVEIIRSW